MTVKEYLGMLPGSQSFLALSDEEIDRWIFTATETLGDYLPKRKITERITALQALYMFGSDQEDFAILKAHGVESFSTEGMSVSFKDNGPSSISPIVIDIINQKGKAKVGSII